MALAALLASLTLAAASSHSASSVQAPATETREERFASLVEDYEMYLTPICRPAVTAAYANYSRTARAAFRKSLVGTPLDAAYRAGLRALRERESHTVHHCDGPPPPPPAPGQPSVDRREQAIRDIEAKLAADAKGARGYFDNADAVFAQLVTIRDETSAIDQTAPKRQAQ